MSKEFDNKVEFENGKVSRRYTEEWAESGIINKEKIPDLVASVVAQNKAMREYIEALQDKIDWILEVNHCCDQPSCFRAGCSSDHK